MSMLCAWSQPPSPPWLKGRLAFIRFSSKKACRMSQQGSLFLLVGRLPISTHQTHPPTPRRTPHWGHPRGLQSRGQQSRGQQSTDLHPQVLLISTGLHHHQAPHHQQQAQQISKHLLHRRLPHSPQSSSAPPHLSRAHQSLAPVACRLLPCIQLLPTACPCTAAEQSHLLSLRSCHLMKKLQRFPSPESHQSQCQKLGPSKAY